MHGQALNIRRVDQLDREATARLSQWVERNSNIWQSPAYLALLKSITAAVDVSLVAADENDQIVGYIPILAKDGAVGVVANSLPFFGSHGGILGDSEFVAGSLCDRVLEYLDVGAFTSFTMIDDPFGNQCNITSRIAQTDYRIGQYTQLSEDVEHHLLPHLHAKVRYGIRQARASSLKFVRDTTDFSTLRRLHRKHMQQIGGTPKPNSFFDFFPKFFEEGQDYDTWSAVDASNKVQGMLLVLYRSNVAEYYMPVWDRDGAYPHILYGLIIRAMTFAAQERECSRWNWGGTWPSQHGVYRFKNRWNAKDVEYVYRTMKSPEIEIDQLHAARRRDEYPFFYVYPEQPRDANTNR